jgi:hypothetical protein
METQQWSDQYKAFYSSASPDQKLKIYKIIKEYIRCYGMKLSMSAVKKHQLLRLEPTFVANQIT